MHHRVEDAVLFRRVRAGEPGLGPTLDRLEADHRVVSDLLDRVEAAAEAMGGPGDVPARSALSRALDELSAHLLAHLDIEEAALEPVPTRLELRDRGRRRSRPTTAERRVRSVSGGFFPRSPRC